MICSRYYLDHHSLTFTEKRFSAAFLLREQEKFTDFLHKIM
jgi:hypothetical protein